jgi:exonuclease III
VSEADPHKYVVNAFRDRLNENRNDNSKNAVDNISKSSVIDLTDDSSNSCSNKISNTNTNTNTMGYNFKFSCNDEKKAGTCVLIAKRLTEPAVRFTMEHTSDSSPDNNNTKRALPHADGGRVIVLQWPSVLFLMTYAPNNGSTLESLQRRRDWDEQVARFLEFHRRGDVRAVWLGDLNTAPETYDVTQPFKWWTQQCNQTVGKKWALAE